LKRPARPRGPPRRDPAQGQTRQGPPGSRTTARVPPGPQVADRQRRPDQRTQTAIRMGPHPPGRHRRGQDLGRIRDPGPQPGQDQHPGELTPAPASARPTRPTSPTGPKSARRLFQVEVASEITTDTGSSGRAPSASRGGADRITKLEPDPLYPYGSLPRRISSAAPQAHHRDLGFGRRSDKPVGMTVNSGAIDCPAAGGKLRGRARPRYT
jgi:hypothetical protein